MQAELHYISNYPNNILKDVEFMLTDVRYSIDDLSLASKGIISTNVISINELSLVLHEAKIQYYLNPIFDTNTLAYCYTVMEVLFVPSTVILQIPIKYAFHHFTFIPFPTYHTNESIIQSEENTDILIQDNKHYLAETVHGSFAQCRIIADLKLCPSNLLPFKDSLTYEPCLKNLFFAHLKMDSLCTCMSKWLATTQVLSVDLCLFISRNLNNLVRVECGSRHTVVQDCTF